MLALLGAVIAGALTTLAPCVLPLLPVIVGGSIVGVAGDPGATSVSTSKGAVATKSRTRLELRRPLVITASLGLSIVVFTLLLKASTSLIGVPPEFWSWISGGILILLGLAAVFPGAWDAVSMKLGLQARSAQRLQAARGRKGFAGEILTGAALGPVFSSCSPLYAYVVVTVIPAETVRGVVLLLAYVIGLCGTLLAIALLGQRFIRKARWIADPHGWFRRGLGVIFVVVGLMVATGLDRDFQAWVLEHSPIAPWELDGSFIPQE